MVCLPERACQEVSPLVIPFQLKKRAPLHPTLGRLRAFIGFQDLNTAISVTSEVYNGALLFCIAKLLLRC